MVSNEMIDVIGICGIGILVFLASVAIYLLIEIFIKDEGDM